VIDIHGMQTQYEWSKRPGREQGTGFHKQKCLRDGWSKKTEIIFLRCDQLQSQTTLQSYQVEVMIYNPRTVQPVDQPAEIRDIFISSRSPLSSSFAKLQ
jgi:hypothetical protein